MQIYTFTVLVLKHKEPKDTNKGKSRQMRRKYSTLNGSAI